MGRGEGTQPGPVAVAPLLSLSIVHKKKMKNYFVKRPRGLGATAPAPSLVARGGDGADAEVVVLVVLACRRWVAVVVVGGLLLAFKLLVLAIMM